MVESEDELKSVGDYKVSSGGESSAPPAKKEESAPPPPAPAKEEASKPAPKKSSPSPASSPPSGDRVFATPAARKLAEDKNVRLIQWHPLNYCYFNGCARIISMYVWIGEVFLNTGLPSHLGFSSYWWMTFGMIFQFIQVVELILSVLCSRRHYHSWLEKRLCSGGKVHGGWQSS